MTTSSGQGAIVGDPRVSRTAREYCSPRPAPRVKPEAEEIYNKSRGSMEKWLNVDNNLSNKYETARPKARVPSETAQQMLEKSKGSMNSFIGGQAEFRPMRVANKHPSRAVKPEAAAVSGNNKGMSTKNLFVNYGNLDLSARPVARLKPESDAIAQGHKGAAAKSIFHDYGKLPRSTRVGKNRPEATEIAHRSMDSKDIGGVLGGARSARTARSVQSSSCPDDVWSSRPSSRFDNYNKRNATTFPTEWT